MSYRNDRFNQHMQSLEVMISGFADASKAKVLSDRGKGVERMLSALDHNPSDESKSEVKVEQRREIRLFEAEMRLVEAGKRHLIPVLLLIVEHGNNRTESIAILSKRRQTGRGRKKFESARKAYKRCLKSLLDFFGVQSVHMEI